MVYMMLSLLQHIVACVEDNRDGSLFQINQCIQSKTDQRFHKTESAWEEL